MEEFCLIKEDRGWTGQFKMSLLSADVENLRFLGVREERKDESGDWDSHIRSTR